MEGFECFSEDITKWDVLRGMVDLDIPDELKNDPNKPSPSVQLLPRQDVMIYGTVPKMEQRIYTKCKECRLIFNPRDILSHKTCSGKAYTSSSLAHSLRKKIKSKSGTQKKSHSSLPLPPLFKKPPSPASVIPPTTLPELVPKVSLPKVTKISALPSTTTINTTTATTTNSISSSSSLKSEGRHSSSASPSKSNSYHHTPKSPKSMSISDHSLKSSKNSAVETVNGNSTPSSTSSSSSSSSRHKKSRKTNSSTSTKTPEEYDPDVHCGVVEGNKGPCTRSITCSNHRIQLRKMVPGRSKDIHHLIAERKAVKERDGKYGSSNVYTSPNGLDSQDVQNAYVPALASTKDSTSYIPVLPKISDLTTSTTNLSDIENNLSKTADVQISSQDSVIGTVPVVYMPMSPISVVNPVEFVKIGKNIICLESPQSATSPPITTNQSVFLTIPSQQQNVKMYKTHPKPIAVPSYGTKKIGGAILLSNQRIESQRNDILMAINSNRKTVNNIQSYRTISSLNHINSLHRPNILKNKSVNKVNCKRSSVEKLNIGDNKQMKLANVNGFILHSDISESADAPQSNNCIQEKISFFNLK